MSSACPSGPPISTLAAPVRRSTSHIEYPTTVPASRRPPASTASPCTPENDDGATSTSAADQLVGRVVIDVIEAQAFSSKVQASMRARGIRFMTALSLLLSGRNAGHRVTQEGFS